MSFWRTYYHLTWSTRSRQPFIQAAIEPDLFSYILHKAGELSVYVYAINGWFDHIHLVASIPPRLAVSEFVKNIKGSSSHLLNHACKLDYTFEWQRGYGVLTLGERQRPDAEAYVRNQKIHHAQQTYIQWLERDSDLDEGPSDIGLKTGEYHSLVRDERASYLVGEGELVPF
jgi:REP element-mobilizing transposase RayT